MSDRLKAKYVRSWASNGSSIGRGIRPGRVAASAGYRKEPDELERDREGPTGVVAGIVVPQYMLEFLERSRVRLALRLAARTTKGRAS